MKLPVSMSRRPEAIGIVIVLVLVAIIAGAFVVKGRGTLKYPGLKTTLEVDMDDATHAYIVQRVAVDEAAIAAQEQKGEKVDLDLYMSLAADAYSLGDLAKAREAVEKQIKGNAANYTAWNLYGTILEDMGDLKGAEKAYRQALNLGGDVEEFYRDLIVLWQTHYYPARKNDVRSLLEEYARKRQTPWNMVELARWYMDDGDCDRALAHYKVARTIAGGNDDIRAEADQAEITCAAKAP